MAGVSTEVRLAAGPEPDEATAAISLLGVR
jgi:hypothetical protein